MNIDRMDLDGVGSAAGIAARIHELLPDMPLPVPVEELCHKLDIISIEELQTDGFEAMLVTDEHKSQGAIVHARGRMAARTRFSIAHELGHFLIPSHRPSADGPMHCSLDHLLGSDTKSKDRRRKMEAEANRFAAHLLMPLTRVRKAILASEDKLEAIAAMADEFGVSKEAMARTWVDNHSEPVAVIIAQHGKIARYYRGEDFPWLAARPGDAIPDGSAANASVSVNGRYTEIDEVEAEVWLDEGAASNALALDEQILFQNQGFAMILLVAELDDE